MKNHQVIRSRELTDSATGRVLVRVEWLRTGQLRVTPGRHCSAAERERAADWVGEFLPHLTHDQRYQVLFGG